MYPGSGLTFPPELSSHQVLLVTGGNSQWNNWQLDEYLATTELLEEGGSEWRTVPNLSRGRNGARAANIGGKIFLLGGQDENKDYPEEVLIIYWA